jgi:hypothetical protein
MRGTYREDRREFVFILFLMQLWLQTAHLLALLLQKEAKWNFNANCTYGNIKDLNEHY